MSETSNGQQLAAVPQPTPLPLNERIAQEVIRRASVNQQNNIQRLQAASSQAHSVALKTDGQLELLTSLTAQGAVIVTATEIAIIAQELIADSIQ